MKQQDCLRRFIFEQHAIRGEWVCLHQSWQQAKQYQVFANADVEAQLGQALAAVVLLAATIKFKGAMILQVQGSGQLKALVAQATHERTIRGLVRSEDTVSANTLRGMLGGSGRMVLTLESGNAEPYQGIVSVDEEDLAGVLKTYFVQSEQLDTRLWLFADQNRAAGLFIQELPGEQRNRDDWQRIEMLAATVTADELLSLDCETLLHRLFHEEQVRLYAPESVAFACNCSREKIAGTLLALGRSELENILLERKVIDVDCQFCGAHYLFDTPAVLALMETPLHSENLSPTRH